jgi:cyclopropane fatty-acyl-phospholipid synthase-like methyltransferase
MTIKKYFSTINLYPFFWPKIYVFLRFIILPAVKIEKLLPLKGSILDVGCGYGFTSIFFAKNKKRKITGLELNPRRVALAKKVSSNIPNVSFKTSNLIDNKQSKFDAIIAIDLLHHISSSNKNTFLSDSFLKLKKDGILIIKDINNKPLFQYYWNYLHDLIMTKFSSLYFLSDLQLKNLLIKNNFKIVKQGKYFSLFYPHIYYVCKKNI